MRSRLLVGFVMLLAVAGAIVLFAQAPRGGGSGAGQPPAAPISGPAAGSASVRLEDWGRLRTAASPILGWKVGVPATGFGRLTFFEAAGKADVLGVANIEGFSTQKLSPEIPKNLDYNLAPGEVTAVKDRLRALSLRMPAYFIATIGPDESTGRKLFEFAKSLGVETIVSAPLPSRWRRSTSWPTNSASTWRSTTAAARKLPLTGTPRACLPRWRAAASEWACARTSATGWRRGSSPLDGLALLKTD